MSSNGTLITSWAVEPPFRVEESDYFALRCEHLSSEVPRITPILSGVRRQLEQDPYGGARLVGGGPGQWCRSTVAGKDAPSLRIYYTIREGVVRLEYLTIAGYEPPAPVLDIRIM